MRIAGNEGDRWDFPYIRRLCASLAAFLRQPVAQQRIIVAAREEGIWWRGEWPAHFARVVAEVDRQRELGPEASRAEAIARMKRSRVVSELPYDKNTELGSN